MLFRIFYLGDGAPPPVGINELVVLGTGAPPPVGIALEAALPKDNTNAARTRGRISFFTRILQSAYRANRSVTRNHRGIEGFSQFL